MSTGSPLREASSMGSSPLAWRRCILAPSTSFFCLARSAACRSCFCGPPGKPAAAGLWVQGCLRVLPHPQPGNWLPRWGGAYLPLVDVPLGAALAMGADPDGGAFEGGALGWAVGAAGLLSCRGLESKSELSQRL